MTAGSGATSPTPEELGVLRLYFGAGDMATAERLATALTEKFPDHVFAWKVLATIAKRTGRSDAALAPMREAVRLDPDDADTHGNLGVILQDLGRWAEAEASYREALRRKPESADAHCNLGNALAGLGRLDEAERSYREAILRAPNHPVALCNLATTLKDLGRTEEAAEGFRAALRAAPDLVEAHYNLGNTLRDLDRPQEAERAYREALRRRPEHAKAHNNLGNVLKDFGRLVEAEACYREAIRLDPDFADAHSNLGIAVDALGRLREAEACYREAIRRKPDYAEAHSNLGIALGDSGRPREAEASYREALRLKPDSAEMRSNLLFALNFAEPYAPEAALAEARRYGSAVSARAAPKFDAWPTGPGDAKLRIGFVSADFCNHPVGFFLESLIAHLDPAAFELFAFPTGPKSDDLTARIKPRFRDWIPIRRKPDRVAANLIRERAIHVLLDLAGHTAGNRLPVFALRPAPVQASWLGYFATTGLPEMDYFLGDPHVCPAGEDRWFTEKLWRLPATWLCLTPPDRAIPVATAPVLANGHVTFGCFGNLAKMNEAVVATWAEILERVPGSRLFLKSKQLRDAGVVAETHARFAARGVAADRLTLEGASPRAAYLRAYDRVDIVLDTFPYPGGTTSSEAIWMGAPVLTLAGARFLSRLGESIARNVGLDDWIAADRADYVRKAAAFAGEPDRLAALRATLRERALRSPLFDAPRFAADFAAALRRMYASRATGPA